jgi:uncharacterized repeat protein (TIGR02059 family)
MNTINTIDTNYFELNGILREKVFLVLQRSLSSVEIVCAYDSRIVLMPNTPLDEITVDGNVLGTAKELIETLNPILFSKQVVSAAGSSRTDSTTLRFTNSIEGITHINTDNSPLSAASYVVDLNGAVEGGGVILHYTGGVNPLISGAPIRAWSGDITKAGNYVLYMQYTGGKLNINVFGLIGAVVEDVTAPTWITGSFEVGNVDANTLVMPLSELLNTGSVPAITDFVVNDGSANPVTAVDLSTANQVRLTLANAVNQGDTVVVSYTAGANPIEDLAGNDAGNINTVSVTNNVSTGLNYFPTSLGQNVTKVNDALYTWSSTYGTAMLVSQTAILTGDFKLQINFDTAVTQGFMLGIDSLGTIRAYNDGSEPWDYGINARSTGGAGRSIINGALANLGTLNWQANRKFYLQRISGVLKAYIEDNGVPTEYHNFGNVGTGNMFALASQANTLKIIELKSA